MPTRPFATSVVRRLSDAGHIAYFAGGWVRDFLMKHPSDDIDIATSATVEEIVSLFPKTIPVGVAFGIVIVVQDGHRFEVATFRKDRGYVDGRRPSGIEPATPEEDAQRRDFTINGMFYDPLSDTLYDFVKGQNDLKHGIIRAIGNPHERFLEDRLRMMRAVRYSTRFGFPIEEETLQAILGHAASLLPAVAMERVWQEFQKMSQFAHFDTGLITLHQLNLLPTIFPELKGVSIEEVKRRLAPLRFFPKKAPAISELMLLFPENPLILVERLKLSRTDRDLVEFLLQKEPVSKTQWAHFYAHKESSLAVSIWAAHRSDRELFLEKHERRRAELEEATERIRTQSPLVKAEDLIALGVARGPKLGELLREAERISIDQGIEDKAIIIDHLKLWT